MRGFAGSAMRLAKTVLWGLAALLISSGLPVFAQTITGTWQGTLPSGESPRIVLKIDKAGDGLLHGILTFIDKGATGVPVLSVNFVPPDLNVSIADITYRGKLSAEGESISGTWTRGAETSPLTLKLATSDTLWSYSGPARLAAMDANADPSFEVATIRPSAPDSKGQSMPLRMRQFHATRYTVSDLVKFAYELRDRQLTSAPPWMGEEKFDIIAEPDAQGQPSIDQDRLMVRKLLADRFSLREHEVQTVFPVYALTIEKSPPKLSPSDADAHEYASIYPREQANGDTVAQFAFFTMADFVNLLMNFIPDRQIVDETGLTGQYDFTFTVPTSALHSSDEDEKSSALIQSVQQVGFKLVPKREAIRVLVIDWVEKPSAN